MKLCVAAIFFSTATFSFQQLVVLRTSCQLVHSWEGAVFQRPRVATKIAPEAVQGPPRTIASPVALSLMIALVLKSVVRNTSRIRRKTLTLRILTLSILPTCSAGRSVQVSFLQSCFRILLFIELRSWTLTNSTNIFPFLCFKFYVFLYSIFLFTHSISSILSRTCSMFKYLCKCFNESLSDFSIVFSFRFRTFLHTRSEMQVGLQQGVLFEGTEMYQVSWRRVSKRWVNALLWHTCVHACVI